MIAPAKLFHPYVPGTSPRCTGTDLVPPQSESVATYLERKAYILQILLTQSEYCRPKTSVAEAGRACPLTNGSSVSCVQNKCLKGV
ncbi:hypothetical protein BDR03DRAFT_937321 [Suillus americanus]|nr:hypothetical protein BDR03DRAFT_937321 [Suillus americanus]